MTPGDSEPSRRQKKKKNPTKKPFLVCTPSPKRPEIESRVTHPLLPAGVWWGKGSSKGKRKPEERLEENRLESRGRRQGEVGQRQRRRKIMELG